MQLSSSQRFLISAACLGLFLFGFQAGAWGVLLPNLMSFYQLTPVTVGPFFVASTVGYIAAVLSSSYLFVQWHMHRVMILGAVVLVMSTFLLGIQPAVLIAVGVYGVIGLATGLLDTCFVTMLSQFPRSAIWLNLSQACFGIGGLVSPLIVHILVRHALGWGNVFFMLSLLSLPLLVLASCVGNHLSVEISGKESHESKSFHRQGQALWKATLLQPHLWLMAILIAVLAGVHGGMSSWFYSFSLSDRQISPSVASIAISGFWMSLLFARLFLYPLAERFRLSRVRFIFICFGGILLSFVSLWLLPGEIGVIVCCILFGLSEGPLYPTIISLVPQFVEQSLFTRSLTVIIMTNIAGVSLLPLVSGALMQSIGYWTLPLFLFGLTGFMLILWWKLGRCNGHVEEK